MFQMRDFCEDAYNDTAPDNGHDPDLPNRHNALCDGRSTWAIVSQSEEIANSEGVPTPGVPQFEILRPDEDVSMANLWIPFLHNQTIPVPFGLLTPHADGSYRHVFLTDEQRTQNSDLSGAFK